MTIQNVNRVFLQSNELNALFNICKLVTQMVKTLGILLYYKNTDVLIPHVQKKNSKIYAQTKKII